MDANGRTIFPRTILGTASVLLVLLVAGLTFTSLRRSPAPPIAAIAATESPRTTRSIRANGIDLPIAFEPNHGQTAKQVRFLGRANGYRLFIEDDETIIAPNGLPIPRRKGHSIAPASMLEEPHLVRIKLLGASHAQKIDARDPLPGRVNYLIGNDPAGWHAGIPTYRTVVQHDVWPGIDLVYYGDSKRQIENDFVIAPGADPQSIRLAFDGSNDLAIDRDGNLQIAAGRRNLTMLKPRIYQRLDGRERVIDGRYLIDHSTGARHVRFELASYDHRRTLVIDPKLTLVYSTYLGGSAFDEGYAIAVDPERSAYVTGRTRSANFPTTSAGEMSGEEDAFVTKFAPDGQSIVYSTLIGGSGGQGFTEAYAIAVSSDGHAYITGVANNNNFPTTAHAFQHQPSHGGGHPFVSELTRDGSSFVFSTYVASNDHIQCQASDPGVDWGTGIAVDPVGLVFVSGITCSNGFPVLVAQQDSSTVNFPAAFVFELDSNGHDLFFSTYLGGIGFTEANAIAIDPSLVAPGIYVTGTTDARDFPTKNAFQPHLRGPSDAFLVKYAAVDCGCVRTRQISYATFLGGGADEEGLGVTVDRSHHAYVVGNFFSSNFPFTNSLNTDQEEIYPASFITKFSENGQQLLYSDWLGEGGNQSINGIAQFDRYAYITGYVGAGGFPTINAFQDTPHGGIDVFVSKISQDGASLVYSTLLGGAGNDAGNGIAVGPGGDAFVTGFTTSHDFPTEHPFEPANPAGRSAFVTKLQMSQATPVPTPSAPQ